MIKKYFGIASAILLVSMQLIFTGAALDELRAFAFAFFGIFGAIILLWINKLSYKHWFLLMPFAYIAIRGLFGYVDGYTIYKIAEYVGIWALMVVASNSDKKYILYALVIAAFIQIAYTYFPINKLYGLNDYWRMQIDIKSNFNMNLYGWGTVRHKIRFATIIISGIIASLVLFKTTKNRIHLMAIPLFLFVVLHSYSNTIITLIAIVVICFIARKNITLAIFAGLFLIFAIKLFGSAYGFGLDSGRSEYWKIAISEPLKNMKFLFGYGLGYWQLLHGNLVGHPHNELLLIFFEHGAIGLLFGFCFYFLMSILKTNNYVFFGFLIISISFLTNSMINYPDMYSVWALWGGMAIEDCN